MSLVLHGFRYSVYVRIARIALVEKGLTYEHIEIDPFATDVPIEYLTLHPFKRVPVLVDGDFALYETEAITRYIDEAFPGPALQPSEPRQRARMAQIISIIDSYGYVPMVRQVAGERVFALCVLAALEAIVPGDGPLAGGKVWSLADLHVAPMIAYFAAAPEGEEVLADYAKLLAWWQVIRKRRSVLETDPGLPDMRSRLS